MRLRCGDRVILATPEQEGEKAKPPRVQMGAFFLLLHDRREVDETRRGVKSRRRQRSRDSTPAGDPEVPARLLSEIVPSSRLSTCIFGVQTVVATRRF